ncbi:MAG: filamentous hemagglutinin N-terminal domain-containing protein [Nitrospira sp.]
MLILTQIICLLLLIASTEIQAEVSTDITPSGLHTTVTPPPHGGTVYSITHGIQVGSNLFHSFGKFSVGPLETGQFQTTTLVPDNSVSNLLARVTGGYPSHLFGSIDSASYYPNANLFFMNPAGIVFGPGATLNVGGSVNFTTANYLRSTDGSLFNAVPDVGSDALLSAAPVVAFGFLTSNSGGIIVQGAHLAVSTGSQLTLAGGNVEIQKGAFESGTSQTAKLLAPNGYIRLGSAHSPGEFIYENLQAAPNRDGQVFHTYGVISLSPQSWIDNRDSATSVISIRSGEFVLNVTKATLSTGTPSTTSDNRDSITLTEGSRVLGTTTSGADGTAISIVTGSLDLSGASQIVTSNESSSSVGGGNLNVVATEAISISGYGDTSTSGVWSDIGIIPSGIFAGTLGGGGDGALTISTPRLTIENSGEVATFTTGAGSGQPITIDVTKLNILSGGRIASTGGWNYLLRGFGDGPGQAGPITIHGADFISIAGMGIFDNPSIIQTATMGANGGTSASINITAPSATVNIENGGRIETLPGSSTEPSGNISLAIRNLNISNGSIRTTGGNGRSGNISVVTSDAISLEGDILGQPPFPITNENPEGTGGTGVINLETKTLTLSNQARIYSSTFSEPLPSTIPKINIHATESILMNDRSDIRVFSFLSDVGSLEISSPMILLSGQSVMNTIGQGAGNSGPININAQNVSLSEGSKLNSSILSGSSGVGGSITIQALGSPAASVVIDGSGSGIFSETKGPGLGGSIFVNANSVTLQNGAHISSRSTGPGSAGNIKVDAGRELMVRNGGITTEAESARGGNIDIIAIDRIHLANGRISTSVLEGSGDSGRITIDPKEVIVQDNSAILTQAVLGRGGDITISTARFLQDPTSLVDASSQFGQSGKVSIQSSTSNLSETVTQLPSKPSEIQALLQNRCAALAGGEQSTFIVAGRDALPSQPGGWLSSPVSMDHFTGEELEHTTSPSAIARVTETEIVSLRRLTPPGFLVRAFASGSTGCHS